MKSTLASGFLVLIGLFAPAISSAAQNPAPAPPGPVPPAILQARSIFLSNSDSDRDLFPGSTVKVVNFPINSRVMTLVLIRSSIPRSRPLAIIVSRPIHPRPTWSWSFSCELT